jgi:hypothetical protein
VAILLKHSVTTIKRSSPMLVVNKSLRKFIETNSHGLVMYNFEIHNVKVHIKYSFRWVFASLTYSLI